MGNPRLITPSLGISKSLLRKRMEQIMGTNKRKVWKKSTIVAVVAVCALASSIPALAYRKPHEYVQGGTGDWSDKDFLVFAQEGEENPMEVAHTDFSQGDTVFVSGNGNDYGAVVCNIRQGQQEQSQSICAHNYMTGTIAEHERHADGSCTVVIYAAQQCAKCGNAVRGDEVSSLTYKSCPHMEADGVESDHKAEDEMEASGAEPDNKAADGVESLVSEMGVVNTDALKVRSAAVQDAAVIALLKEGVVAKVVAEENGFYRILIKVEGYEKLLDGYVRKEYIDLWR